MLGKRMYSNSKNLYREIHVGKKPMSPDLHRPMEDVWPIHMFYPHAWPSQGGLSEGREGGEGSGEGALYQAL